MTLTFYLMRRLRVTFFEKYSTVLPCGRSGELTVMNQTILWKVTERQLSHGTAWFLVLTF